MSRSPRSFLSEHEFQQSRVVTMLSLGKNVAEAIAVPCTLGTSVLCTCDHTGLSALMFAAVLTVLGFSYTWCLIPAVALIAVSILQFVLHWRYLSYCRRRAASDDVDVGNPPNMTMWLLSTPSVRKLHLIHAGLTVLITLIIAIAGAMYVTNMFDTAAATEETPIVLTKDNVIGAIILAFLNVISSLLDTVSEWMIFVLQCFARLLACQCFVAAAVCVSGPPSRFAWWLPPFMLVPLVLLQHWTLVVLLLVPTIALMVVRHKLRKQYHRYAKTFIREEEE